MQQLEALLFGQANLLREEFADEYPDLVQREYIFFKKKYRPEPSCWKKFRRKRTA
jgi:hypothetical protein